MMTAAAPGKVKFCRGWKKARICIKQKKKNKKMSMTKNRNKSEEQTSSTEQLTTYLEERIVCVLGKNYQDQVVYSFRRVYVNSCPVAEPS